jgi:hypothetical protein
MINRGPELIAARKKEAVQQQGAIYQSRRPS